MEVGTSGFLAISDSNRKVPAELGPETQASSCVEEWNSACFLSCSQGDRPLVELCVEPVFSSRQCTGVSVTLRVVPSSTGLLSKRCPGIEFFSRSDWEIGVFWHVAPLMRLHLEFPRQTSLILRCAGKFGNPFQAKQGNRHFFRHQGGKGAQMKWCREPRCSPRVRPEFWGTFGVASLVSSTFLNFQTEPGTSLETL